MELLPDASEQAWLLEQLARSLARAGPRSWLVAPILEPTNRWFPDRWRATPGGVERLARRLLRYAGVEELEVVVDVRIDRSAATICKATPEVPVWLDRVDDASATFGADLDRLADPDAVVAATCHAVAHVVRERRAESGEHEGTYRATPRRAEATDAETEETLSDLVTVELGFGILTTNATERHRSSGYVVGTQATSTVTIHRLGALSLQSMSFLLAAQATSRGMSAKQRRRIAAQLETNQATCFEAACKLLGANDPPLASTLALPRRERWPEPPDLDALTAPLAMAASAKDDEPLAPEPAPLAGKRHNEGSIVFRVRRTRTLGGSVLGSVGGLFAGIPFLSMGTWPALALGTIGGIAGFLVGSRLRADACSDPECEQRLELDDTKCPRCGGTIAHEIARATDRLDALEELETKHAADEKARAGRRKKKRGKRDGADGGGASTT